MRSRSRRCVVHFYVLAAVAQVTILTSYILVIVVLHLTLVIIMKTSNRQAHILMHICMKIILWILILIRLVSERSLSTKVYGYRRMHMETLSINRTMRDHKPALTASERRTCTRAVILVSLLYFYLRPPCLRLVRTTTVNALLLFYHVNDSYNDQF